MITNCFHVPREAYQFLIFFFYHTGCEDMKSDIMFLVDSSGSIGDANFETMKIFMKNLVGKIQIGANETQVGVVQFSDYNKEEFQLNTFFTHKEIYAAIDRMSPINRNTLTGSALTFVNEYFDLSKGAVPRSESFSFSSQMDKPKMK